MNSNWCEAVRESGDSNEKEQSDNASIDCLDNAVDDSTNLDCQRPIRAELVYD